MSKVKLKSFKKVFELLYLKLIRVDDTPQKIALGLGLGVFSGIIPGTGILTALFLALILRANRASALFGAILTNTWLSFLTFILSIKIGSVILKVKWQNVYNDWILFLKDFRWLSLFKLPLLKIIGPVVLGYIVVAFYAGFLVYLTTLIILTITKIANKPT